jgi:protein-tyrosine phosphatase
VIPSLLHAGECPWEISKEKSHIKVLLSMGIRNFITLRDDLDIPEIRSTWNSIYPDISISQYPIRDYSVPERRVLDHILDTLQANIDSHRKTYVSCAKGLGRTGLVIASFLTDYYQISPEQALKHMNQLRLNKNFHNEYDSPETQEQINYVMNRKSKHSNES